MDQNLFLDLVSNILDIPAYDVTEDSPSLETFEKKHCFDKNLQPMYTAEALRYLLHSASPATFYEVVDYLNVAIVFFLIEDRAFLVGPYAKSGLTDRQIEALLIENGAPISKTPALKLYCTGLPILYSPHIQKILEGILKTLCPGFVSFDYRRLTGFVNSVDKGSDAPFGENKQYSEIYKRYDAERRFLSMIRNGDVEGLMSAFRDMTRNSISTFSSKELQRYYSSDKSVAILRALSRKAAEESGLSVITIDSITQKYAQLAYTNMSAEVQQKLVPQMLIELTRAVRDHLLSMAHYSPLIQKVMEFIALHLSEEMTLKMLSDHVGLSVSRLSTLFKQETGYSIMAYIAKQRCKKAATLLRETRYPISEISSFVGYDDSNYFVKVFKKIYGLTPSDYRAKDKAAGS